MDEDTRSDFTKYGTTGILNPRAANYWFERAAKQGHKNGAFWYASSLCENMYFLKDYKLDPNEGLAWYVVYFENDLSHFFPVNAPDNKYIIVMDCRQNLGLMEDNNGWNIAVEKAQKRALKIQKTF